MVNWVAMSGVISMGTRRVQRAVKAPATVAGPRKRRQNLEEPRAKLLKVLGRGSYGEPMAMFNDDIHSPARHGCKMIFCKP